MNEQHSDARESIQRAAKLMAHAAEDPRRVQSITVSEDHRVGAISAVTITAQILLVDPKDQLSRRPDYRVVRSVRRDRGSHGPWMARSRHRLRGRSGRADPDRIRSHNPKGEEMMGQTIDLEATVAHLKAEIKQLEENKIRLEKAHAEQLADNSRRRRRAQKALDHAIGLLRHIGDRDAPPTP